MLTTLDFHSFILLVGYTVDGYNSPEYCLPSSLGQLSRELLSSVSIRYTPNNRRRYGLDLTQEFPATIQVRVTLYSPGKLSKSTDLSESASYCVQFEENYHCRMRRVARSLQQISHEFAELFHSIFCEFFVLRHKETAARRHDERFFPSFLARWWATKLMEEPFEVRIPSENGASGVFAKDVDLEIVRGMIGLSGNHRVHWWRFPSLLHGIHFDCKEWTFISSRPVLVWEVHDRCQCGSISLVHDFFLVDCGKEGKLSSSW